MKLLSPTQYCQAIALAFLASPDGAAGNTEEDLLHDALHAACERFEIDPDDILEGLIEEHGEIAVEGMCFCAACGGCCAHPEPGE